MNFRNHAPINMNNATILAKAATDGGAYDGIGYNRYTVYAGNKYHLVHAESSGREYNNKVDRSCDLIASFPTQQDLIDYLVKHPPSWWTNELLEDLQYEGPDA